MIETKPAALNNVQRTIHPLQPLQSLQPLPGAEPACGVLAPPQDAASSPC